MYGYWVTMELLSDRLVVTPVNLLPVEREGTPTDAEILDQKKRILKDIVGRPNEELEADEDAMQVDAEEKVPPPTMSAIERQMVEEDCSYTSTEAAPSFRPHPHYCDITGLEGPYTDPKTMLRYHDKDVYEMIQKMVMEPKRDWKCRYIE